MRRVLVANGTRGNKCKQLLLDARREASDMVFCMIGEVLLGKKTLAHVG